MSSEDFDMNDSTWMSADPHLASSLSPSQDERMRSPQNLHSQEDGEYPGQWGYTLPKLEAQGSRFGAALRNGPGSWPPPAFSASPRVPCLSPWL